MSAARVRAAQRFFKTAIAAHGIREGDHVRIPMRQCDLARQRGVAPSTIGAYLTALGDTVIAREPHIVLQQTAFEPEHASGDRLSATRGARSGEVLAIVAELLEVQARLLRALTATDPRGVTRHPREEITTANDPRVAVADLDEGRKEEQALPSFHPSPIRASNAIEPRAAARYDELLEPLHRACRELHLTPLNNPRPLEAALAPYSDQQISDAVLDLVHELRHGATRIASPFGLLTNRARRGLATTAPTSPAPTSPSESIEEPSVSADPASDAIRWAEQHADGETLLDELDHAIHTANPALRLHTLPAPMLRALRADELRARNTTP